jgi:hypothetical protein
MYNRTNIPSGGAGLLLLAIAVAPVIIKKCKPAVKAVGEALVKAGAAVQKAAS